MRSPGTISRQPRGEGFPPADVGLSARWPGRTDSQHYNAGRELLREIVEARLTAHAPALAGKPELARALSSGDAGCVKRRGDVAGAVRRGEAGRVRRDGRRLAAGSGGAELIQQTAIQQGGELGFVFVVGHQPGQRGVSARRGMEVDFRRALRQDRQQPADGVTPSCGHFRPGRSSDR